MLDPPVISLTDVDFELRVAGKAMKELWFVDYYTPWCPPCMQMMSEWRKFAKVSVNIDYVYIFTPFISQVTNSLLLIPSHYVLLLHDCVIN